MKKSVYLIGFGSQGSAWAECLRDSGLEVLVYLPPNGKTWPKAVEAGFHPKPLDQLREIPLSELPSAIPMMIPDHEIGPVYSKYLAKLPQPLDLILAHGYAVYSESLKPENPRHLPFLLAPKSIGPKLRSAYKEAKRGTHNRAAGFFAPDSASQTRLREFARGMGFSDSHLIETTFEKETLGDLISEQGLLCGGIFTLLEWTMESMAKAGVPDALIREECLTELELIAGLLREKGPATTFSAISQAAQCGTIAMSERFQSVGLRNAFEEQVDAVVSKRFVEYMNEGSWKGKAEKLIARLKTWETRLNGPKGSP